MHTDKPQSLSVRDYIIRRLSFQLRQSEDIISSVISHQFISAISAMKNSKEIEISGIGKFLFSNRKAVKRLNKLEQIKLNMLNLMENVIDESRSEKYKIKINSIDEEVNYIKNKLNNELDK